MFFKLTIKISNAAVSTAQEGLNSANAGVQTIAEALKQGQTAPANARTQVEDGLAKAQMALSGAHSWVILLFRLCSWFNVMVVLQHGQSYHSNHNACPDCTQQDDHGSARRY